MLDNLQKNFCQISVENNIWTTSELSLMFNVDIKEVEESLDYIVEELDPKSRGYSNRENKWINNRIKEFYEQGFSAKDTAMQLGLSPAAMSARCQKLGLNFEQRQKEIRAKNIIRFAEKKTPLKEIAKELKLSESAVRYHARNEGYKTRKGELVKIEDIG